MKGRRELARIERKEESLAEGGERRKRTLKLRSQQKKEGKKSISSSWRGTHTYSRRCVLQGKNCASVRG